jgi:hypothetical protein
MRTFIAVDDDLLARRIVAASDRVVFVAPAVSTTVATALGDCFSRADRVSITIVLDPNEEGYRLGYGDREGLEQLQQLAGKNHIGLRSQPGLRIGLLVVDDYVLVWSPTPKAVEGQRIANEPNGIDLGDGVPRPDGTISRDKDRSDLARGGTSQTQTNSLVDIIRNAIGSDDSEVLLAQAEIGRVPFTPEQIAKTVEVLKQNPPAPFDLARKTRVFSTKFQFVEFELRGAAWTNREIKLSSLLLNPDVPNELQDLFETKVKPFSAQGDVAIDVPTLVQGQVAYNREGEEIVSPMTQGDIEKSWKELLKRYLKQMVGFGWLIQRADKVQFELDVAAYEIVLKAWVAGFRKVAANDEAALVKRIVELVNTRAGRPTAKEKLKDIDIEATVRAGIQKLRITEPSVKLVFKEISWESTRDAEFTEALRKALPAEALNGWFEVFTAARQQSGGDEFSHGV